MTKRFSDMLKSVGMSKSKLARELDISPEQVSRWGDDPPRYALAYVKQLEKNRDIQAKLDAFMNVESDTLVFNNQYNNSCLSRDAYIKHVSEILDPGFPTVAVFTKGAFLEIRDNQTGYTGNWVIDPDRCLKKVLIYLREESGSALLNRIYLGDYVWAEGPVDDGRRYRIHFKQLEEVGMTDQNWKDFTGGGANPVKYFCD